jgi:hypothetical protein
VVYPDGRRETLLFVPKYDFNWQTLYRLEKPVFLPKGTRMVVTAHFDNSEKNKYNPDPTKAVRFGDPTYDEMMVGYFDFVNNVRTNIKVDPSVLSSYAGEYAVGPISFTVSADGNQLMFTGAGIPKVEAYPESENKFYFTVVDAQVTFLKNEEGQVSELVFEINGRTIKAKRVSKVTAEQAAK